MTPTEIAPLLFDALCHSGREPSDRMVEAWVRGLGRRVPLDDVQEDALIRGVDEALGDLEARRQVGEYPGPLTLEHVWAAYRKHRRVIRAEACGPDGCSDGLVSIRGENSCRPCDCPRGQEQRRIFERHRAEFERHRAEFERVRGGGR